MAPPISKRGIRAVALLNTPHPKDPTRCYTITEAAKKAGTSRSAVYRQMERDKATQAKEQK